MNKASIFISYSHKDEKWKDLLVNQLGVLEQQGAFDTWTDREIGAGEDWSQAIEDALKNATVAVLLVSANSLTSEFILNNEAVRMLERREKEGLRIIPIIVSDCAWNQVKWLARMQVRPRDGKPLDQVSPARRATELKNIVAEVGSVIAARSSK
jgi:TIR domain-containing protein